MRDPVLTTHSPIVKIENTELVSYADISGDGDCALTKFKKQFFWVRTAEASVHLYHDEQFINHLETFSTDSYDKHLECLNSAIEYAKAFCQKNGVTSISNIRVAVQLIIDDIPAVFDLSAYAKIIMDAPFYWRKQITYKVFDGGGDFVPNNCATCSFAYNDNGEGANSIRAWLNSSNSDAEVVNGDAIPWVEKTCVLNDLFFWDSRLHLGDQEAIAALQADIESRRNVQNLLEELLVVYDAKRKMIDSSQ